MNNHICIEHIERIEQCIEKRIDSIHSDLIVPFEMSSIIVLYSKNQEIARIPDSAFLKNSDLKVQSLDSIIYAEREISNTCLDPKALDQA